MKIAVFDVETTDLIKNNPSFNDTNKWPYIVQITLIIYDTSNDHIDTINNIIKIPLNAEINIKSQEIHGYTKEYCNTNGVELKPILLSINNKLNDVDIIVGHNISFDKRMYIVECIRNNIVSCFNKKEYCFCMKRMLLLFVRYNIK